jgi:pimeloyl-ACP methyl ester carboxylesterase
LRRARHTFFSIVVAVLALQHTSAPAGSLSGEPGAIWLLHLPGMGGLMNIDRNVTAGMKSGLHQVGGVEPEIQIYDWTGPDRGFASLSNTKRHAEQAKVVADMIVRRARQDPSARIVVTGHSAGTGIIVWALERLPEDVKIDELVMIASALSPGYDLSPALSHVRGRAYALNSRLDGIVLGAGTKVFGTVDRLKVEAAGMVGFTIPEKPAIQGQYEKLVQLPYDPDWMRFGNNGEHIGPMTRSFGRKVISPIILGKGPPPRASTQPADAPTTSPAGASR